MGGVLLIGGIGYELLSKREPHTSAAINENERALDRPYADWRQQEVPFGVSSIDLAPWRSYMDTWDGSRFLDTLGVVLNGVSPEEADATAQLLAESGIRSARIEIGWGNISFDNETLFNEPQGSRLRTILSALKNHRIRPIILLNANAGNPVPSKKLKLRLKKNASKGSKEIYVDNVAGIVPHYTGLSGQAYQTMYPVVTAVDAKTGKLTLSAPLTNALKAGDLQLTRLKYRPLSGTQFSNGKENPAAQQTLAGWGTYLSTVTKAVMRALGTENNAMDKGFDLEVWNEMTFGSQFLDIGNYYNPKLQFTQYPVYAIGDRKATGGEVLLPITVAFAAQKKLSGVRVISGFSNQRPWENGTEIFDGQAGFSRHYYTGYSGQSTFAHTPQTDKRKYVSATGKINVGASDYLPTHTYAMPEYWFYAYHTEYVVRDLQPYPGPFVNHGRYANPGNGETAEVWMTETNWWRSPFADKLALQTGVSKTDMRLRSLLQQIGAKASLRIFTFYSHKGVQTVELYSAKGGDSNYGLINDAFFEELGKNGFKLTDRARMLAGPQIAAISRVSKIMQQGRKIENPRPLQVTGLVEEKPRIAIPGNGTADHPDTYHADDFAVLPYQLDANKFAIGFYVVTRDLTREWQSGKSALDPSKYAMPAQKYKISLSNIDGEGAAVYAYDPMTDQRIPARIVEGTSRTMTVEVESVDYPRFLIVEENKTSVGPLIDQVKLAREAQETGLSFRVNRAGTAKITWGPYPIRTGGMFTLSKYESMSAPSPVSSTTVSMISSQKAPLTKGIWVFKGKIEPRFTEDYAFIADTNSCKFSLMIDGKYVLNGCGKDNVKNGSIRLAAGQAYEITFTIENIQDKSLDYTVYWASASQSKAPVSSIGSGTDTMELTVDAGAPVSVALPGFKVGDGVRIAFKSDEESVETRFPQWDYDPKGVLWPSG
ncbi:hypothetical protein [Cohnella sp. JJ-181]|uniref:hypothetical protein n=1 Tax=Cohnella rhizoplanae TaxID=2974897 RepID=UPI0022FF703E|nr:hypothetical protein [Cohnella sp. JJ-181]CAI6036401.1 hypothetical protein COHCIP112018_00909 [Cohnella sp. JJ-181]